MRFVIVLVVLVLPNLVIARDPNAYCKRYVKRPMARKNKNGTETIENVSKIVTVCCKGYSLYRKKCVPLCENLCVNSKCTAPNVCTCNAGYKRHNKFRCDPVCDNCKYGFCSSPGICNCYSGYEKNTMTGICEPQCDPPCVNGYCTDPDFCLCFEGYHILKPNTNKCELNSTTTETYTQDSTTKFHSTSSILDESDFETSTSNEELNSFILTDSTKRMHISHDSTDEYEYSTDRGYDTTKAAVRTETAQFDFSTKLDIIRPKFVTDEVDPIEKIIRHQVVEQLAKIDEKHSTNDSDEMATEDAKYMQPVNNTHTNSNSEEITTKLIDRNSKTTAAVETIKSSTGISYSTQFKTETSTVNRVHNDIQTIHRSGYNTESTIQPAMVIGTDSSIFKEEINSSAKNVRAWLPALIASLAALLIVAIILMITVARRYLEGKEYNIVKNEKRKGVATYFNEKETVVTAW